MNAHPTAGWAKAFGNLPPLGHVLRDALPHRWTRFHALPGSKRYADTAVEWAILLARANELGSRCFEISTKICLIRESSGHYPKVNDPENGLVWHHLLHWDGSDELDQSPQDFEYTHVGWQVGSFDWLFRAIADEKARAMFFSEPSGTVFAPYDGGFDLIVRTSEHVKELEREFGPWMSTRPDKL